MKIIAAILEPAVITKMLTYLGLPTGHLRCAVPASFAVQPVLPVLTFAPPFPALTSAVFLGSIFLKWPNSTPTRRFYPVLLPSRQSPVFTACLRPENAAKLLTYWARQSAKWGDFRPMSWVSGNAASVRYFADG